MLNLTYFVCGVDECKKLWLNLKLECYLVEMKISLIVLLNQGLTLRLSPLESIVCMVTTFSITTLHRKDWENFIIYKYKTVNTAGSI